MSFFVQVTDFLTRSVTLLRIPLRTLFWNVNYGPDKRHVNTGNFRITLKRSYNIIVIKETSR